MVLILDPPPEEASQGPAILRGGPEIERVAAAIVDEILGANGNDSSIYDVVASRLPERAGPHALRPGPEVDAALGRLVTLLVSRLDALHPNPLSHWEVRRSACQLIETDPARRQQARSVRRAAGHAESLMEVHYANRLLADRAPSPATASDPKQLLRWLLRWFPYLRNYELLVEAELAGFHRVGSADRVAFCGAGALPLTAIVWHLATKSAVTLVDVDPNAAHLASQVIQRLAQEDVLEEGALTVEVADAAEFDPRPFELIVVASLVPNDVVVRLAGTVAEVGDEGPVLMTRSALGLTRLLAYEAVDVEAIKAAGLRHIGTVAPCDQVSEEADLPGIAVKRSDRLLHCASSDVLNTSEYFAATDRLNLDTSRT